MIDPCAVSPSELAFVSGKEKQIVNIQRSIGANIVVPYSVSRQRRAVALRLRGHQGRGRMLDLCVLLTLKRAVFSNIK